MKKYPSIKNSSEINSNEKFHVFVKYDGSNIRAEYSSKSGWNKFGTRKQLLEDDNVVLAQSKYLFLNKYASDLEGIFHKKYKNVKQFIVFFEFFGANSFAGMHQPNDAFDVVVFDINPLTKGIVSPKEFLDNFSHVNVAECLFETKINNEFIEEIRNEKININSKYEIKANIPEGVICKSGEKHNINMFKIKTFNYLSQLKNKYNANWIDLWE